MDIVVALWLVFSAFILGANTGTPEGASTRVENLNATPEVHRSTEADADVPIRESIQEPACSTGPQGRIYRDLTRPYVTKSE